MSKISFLISTNRPYDNCAKKVIDCIENQGFLEENEIIVCSNEKITDSRIINIEDNEKINGHLGFNQAAKISNGEILIVLCDDHYVEINSNIYNLFNTSAFDNRKFKIATAATRQDHFMPAYIGYVPGYPQTNIIPRAIMCRFPVLTRCTYEKLGNYIFHPKFNLRCSFFPDNYLSYFLHLNGEETIQTADIVLSSYQHEINHTQDNSLFGPSLDIYMELIENLNTGDSYV